MWLNKLQSKISFFCLLFCLFCVGLFAQLTTNSPYSRFGLGELNNRGFASNIALGNVSAAFANDTLAPIFINTGNPASFSTLRITAFEAGVNASFNEFANSTAKTNSTNLGLNYLSLGFPLGKKAGACASFQPYSQVGYSISNSKETENIGNVKELYEGDGGLNRLSAGLGVRPFEGALKRYLRSQIYRSNRDSGNYKLIKQKRFWKRFAESWSIGASGSYLFGNIEHNSKLYFPTSSGVYNTKVNRQTYLSDFTGLAGTQFSFTIDSLGKRNLKQDVKITFGYTYSLGNTISADYSLIATRFVSASFGREITRDTVLYLSEASGKITLPVFHTLGMCIKKGDVLSFFAEAEIQQWSKYSFLSETNSFKDAIRLSTGIQILPKRMAVGNLAYFKKIHYRAGFKYLSGYLNINNQRIDDRAITLGLGLPVGKFKMLTIVNVSAELGRVGDIGNNLIQHNYARITLGFTFNDRWFIKTKYD